MTIDDDIQKAAAEALRLSSQQIFRGDAETIIARALQAERDAGKAALEAEREKVAKLREAVRPMAEVSTDVPEEYPDDYQVVTSCGHFRAAARAYKETGDA